MKGHPILESQTLSSRRKDAAANAGDLRLDVQLVRADGRVVWEAKGLATTMLIRSRMINSKIFSRAPTAAAVATRIAERIFNRFTDDF